MERLMSGDTLDLKKFVRTVENFPIDGITFRDITSLIEAPEAFVKTCDELTNISREFDADIIASIESRGFIFAGTIARDLHLPFVLARKPGKLPNQTYKKSFDLEYGSTSIEIQKNTQISSDQKVVIVDDLVATGGTAIACAELLTENFGVKNSNILILTIIDLLSLGGNKLINQRGFKIKHFLIDDKEVIFYYFLHLREL
jgi:adenine phosphoribosyltransferase